MFTICIENTNHKPAFKFPHPSSTKYKILNVPTASSIDPREQITLNQHHCFLYFLKNLSNAGSLSLTDFFLVALAGFFERSPGVGVGVAC